MRDPRSIVITGGSSGLGAALAREYSRPGVSIALTGRDAARLAAVAAECSAAGAKVRTAVLDVVDAGKLDAWLREVDAATPVDLLIANAGVSGGTGGGGEGDAQVRTLFAVNLDGVVNSVLPLLPSMRSRGRGQVALMSSLAGFRGFPSAPAYCASKAAVRVWGEGLRGVLVNDGIEVTVICPGFVRTPMTAVNPFPMPFLMDAARAARIVRKGLEAGKGRIAFPLPTFIAAWLLSVLPDAVAGRLVRHAPGKPPVEGETGRD
jgi:short-subunit dehydrogenase